MGCNTSVVFGQMTNCTAHKLSHKFNIPEFNSEVSRRPYKPVIRGVNQWC